MSLLETFANPGVSKAGEAVATQFVGNDPIPGEPIEAELSREPVPPLRSFYPGPVGAGRRMSRGANATGSHLLSRLPLGGTIRFDLMNGERVNSGGCRFRKRLPVGVGEVTKSTIPPESTGDLIF